jgi:LasA protease
MKRLITLLIVLSLTACSTGSSLWGVRSTPTPRDPGVPPHASETPSDIPTVTPIPTDTLIPTGTITPTTSVPTQTLVQVITPNPQDQPVMYYAQSGDSLAAVASRFSVDAAEITSPKNLPQSGLVDAGTLLIIPDRITGGQTSNVQLIPDSEIIFSPSGTAFDIAGFITDAGGFLSSYKQWITSSGWTNSTDVIDQLALNNSVNPRLLLALLEYESGWVYGTPTDMFREKFPMGYQIQDDDQGLYKQLQWAVNQLFDGYYGWRMGTLTDLTFPDGETLRLAPDLNAGTVALQYFFSRQRNRTQWERVLDPDSSSGFPALYTEMFGDPGVRAQIDQPIFPPSVVQPELVLPFRTNDQWNYTSGPHGAWDRTGPLAAIDFAPASKHQGCEPSNLWAVAAAAGVVVRSGKGIVVLDLDGDGNEQTGWDLFYLHMGEDGRAKVGQWVQVNDHIGHPSCEGGASTGRHLHLARKFNGEWIIADSPLPFILSGWLVHAGEIPYKGTMTRGATTVTADPYGQVWSVIVRLPNE